MTVGQIQVLFDHAQREEDGRLRFEAAIHGAKFKKSPRVEKREIEEGPMTFKDPSAYAHMTQEEKEALTKKMMGHWKRWAGSAMEGKGSAVSN